MKDEIVGGTAHMETTNELFPPVFEEPDAELQDTLIQSALEREDAYRRQVPVFGPKTEDTDISENQIDLLTDYWREGGDLWSIPIPDQPPHIPDDGNWSPIPDDEFPPNGGDVDRIMTEHEAIAIVNRHLSVNPQIRKAMVWGFGQEGWDHISKLDDSTYWKDYDNWPTDFKREFEQIAARKMIIAEPILSLLPGKRAFSFAEVKQAYLIMVAHAVVLDLHKTMPWSLTDFPQDQLHWLLDGRYLCFSYETDRDRGTGSTPHPGYQFGISEKLDSVYSKAPDFVSIPSQVLPADPLLTFNKVFNDMKVNLAKTPRDAISLVSRWVQDNVDHGQVQYNKIFHNWKSIEQYYPPLEMVLLGRISAAQARSLRNILGTDQELRQMGLPKSLKPSDLINLNGVVADPAFEQPAGFVGFRRHSLYNGCQAGGSFLQWLFRSINLPAKAFASFLGDAQLGNYPTAFHKSVEVSDGSYDTLALAHADNLYVGQSIPGVGSGTFSAQFFDPHIELRHVFWRRSALRRYLPDHPTGTSAASAQRRRDQFERYLSLMLLTGANHAFSAYVLPWWREWDRVGRDDAKVVAVNVVWLDQLGKLAHPSGLLMSSALTIAISNIKKRIADIEAGRNTLWGTTLADYEVGYKTWLGKLSAGKIHYKIWKK